MADSPIERLIEASSLGTPDARLLRGTVADEVARRIVARSEEIRAAIDAATPCFAPDITRYWRAFQQHMSGPVRAIRGPAWAVDGCDLWYCPTSGQVECSQHGGFDVCCDQTDLHQPIAVGLA